VWQIILSANGTKSFSLGIHIALFEAGRGKINFLKRERLYEGQQAA